MIKLILGPPGSGKTTTLLNYLKEHIKTTDINKIAYVSFTKAAINEVQIRVGRKDLPYFRTLHSTCFRLLALNRNQMVNNHYQDIFNRAMEQKGYYIDFELTENINERNLPLYMYHLAVNKCQSLEEIHYKNEYDFDLTLDTLQKIIYLYKDFKGYYRIFDFNDLLAYVILQGYTLHNTIDTVFLDEAQDFTPLQWQVFWQLFGKCKNIYICGDDDQSIFEWSGVDISKFTHVQHDIKQTLDITHRLPKNILQFSKKIITKIPDNQRYTKKIETKKPKGILKTIHHINDLDFSNNESWLFLVRNIYLAQHWQTYLMEYGLPFLYFGKRSIEKNDYNLIRMWETIRKNPTLLDPQNKHLLSEYISEFDIKKEWYFAFNKMDINTANYYRACLRNRQSLSQFKIEVTTIHRVKGREADNVVILPDFSRKTENNLEKEHRVFYVAVTRAKKNLYLMEPQTNLYYEY